MQMILCAVFNIRAKLRSLRALRFRLKKFNLEIAEDKTKIIPFGRFAEKYAIQKGDKAATFDFLGFTHYCGKSKEENFEWNGNRVGRKSKVN